MRAREAQPVFLFNGVYVHPRKTKIKAKMGKEKDAQSKIRTAISRFVRRRTNLVL
jgi:hypothetical protein